MKGADGGNALVAEAVRLSALLDDGMRKRDGAGTGWERCYTF